MYVCHTYSNIHNAKLSHKTIYEYFAEKISCLQRYNPDTINICNPGAQNQC